jgi:hypothetical protein
MNRLSIILRSDLPTGMAMNACGHLGLGMSGVISSSALAAREFYTKDSTGPVATLSDHPLIVLESDSNETLHAIFMAARSNPDLVVRMFSDVFFHGLVEDQARITASSSLGGLQIAAVMLFGPKSALSKLTRGLPLYGT